MGDKATVDSHRSFAANNALFKRCCELAGIPATKRQSAKWHLKKGLAYRHKLEAAQLEVV